MQDGATEDSDVLVGVDKASTALNLSEFFLYRLPRDTPGVYKFGRAVRFDLGELKAWARHRGGSR